MAQRSRKQAEGETFSQKIGKRIREERLRLNLTQEKLAEDVDLSMAYIGQVERKRLTIHRLPPGQIS